MRFSKTDHRGAGRVISRAGGIRIHTCPAPGLLWVEHFLCDLIHPPPPPFFVVRIEIEFYSAVVPSCGFHCKFAMLHSPLLSVGGGYFCRFAIGGLFGLTKWLWTSRPYRRYISYSFMKTSYKLRTGQTQHRRLVQNKTIIVLKDE